MNRGSLELAAADRSELERFKREVNLSEFAAARGYRVDRRESSRTSVVMRHEPSDDKIIVSRAAADQHWTYFSVRDATDNGTIIDFLQHRERVPLGAIRQTLRAWLGAARPVLRPYSFATPSLAAGPDRAGVCARFAAARDVESSAYLESRGLRPSTLGDEQFRGTYKVDGRGNVLFPHYDEEGLSGFESKNRGWNSFCPGGVKALWVSRTFQNDDRLVLTEERHRRPQPPPPACRACKWLRRL